MPKSMVMGILAHVDAGKTTLSEGMLYTAGKLRSLGRVDHGDSFLDHNQLERKRGITIFSKQASFTYQDCTLQLLDTPGHVDFSAEMERTLRVLDFAILVISGTDGVQSHTKTVWNLLKHYQVPVMIFCNKMDLMGADRERLLLDLKHLDENCIDFTARDEAFYESVAVAGDEALLQYFLENGSLLDTQIQSLIAKRSLFPVFFGSALKLEGVEELLDGIVTFAQPKPVCESFGARVFKITRDERGVRETHIKITGGSLLVRTLLSYEANKDGNNETKAEKVDQIRLYNGTKYVTIEQAMAGQVCVVTGLSATYPGLGFGFEETKKQSLLMPVLSYQVLAHDHTDQHKLLTCFRILEEEDPELRVIFDERHQEIHVQLMGDIQLEVLKSLAFERFGIEVTFGEGSIVYKETIQHTVEGIGHFEPLRHYAEVHLLMEPLEAGSGLIFESNVREDDLDLNWQRLILTHLSEKTHLGVLTGSAITDLKITLIAGRAHLKHTEGGDFRQATYRAVRNGLMKAESVLLEPIYGFTLELPMELLGRAMNDIERMGGMFKAPESDGVMAILCGQAPVAAMNGYTKEVLAYTSGRGHLGCVLTGYAPCQNSEEIIAKYAYDAEADLDNTADSVFCSHGAGFVVPWYEVEHYAHLATQWGALEALDADEILAREAEALTKSEQRKREAIISSGESSMAIGTEEIDEIMLRTYGVSKREMKRQEEARHRAYQTGNVEEIPKKREKEYVYKPRQVQEEYLLVDGYNMIFAWQHLKELAKDNLDAARNALIEALCNYQGYVKCHLILVFDAYRVKGRGESIERRNDISIVYTKEAETADAYIEKTTHQLTKNYKVRVATSDGLEQVIIMGAGALRVSAREFLEEVNTVNERIREHLAD